MADNLKSIPFTTPNEGVDFPQMAKDLVLKFGVKPLYPKLEAEHISIDMVYIVWFTFTLGNWKALCSTSLPDGRYYEVTFDKSRSLAFVDTYRKTHNIEITVL